MRTIARVLEVSRSNLYEKQVERRTMPIDAFQTDSTLLDKIKELIAIRPTYGYRRITALLNKEAEYAGEAKVNHKRVYRVMKHHGLLLPKHGMSRPCRTHTGKIRTLRSNTRWCSDYFAIPCWNGDRIYVAFSLDTCDREAMCYVASTIGIDGQAIRDLMVETFEYRFKGIVPKHDIQWLSDNGPAYIARDTVEFGRRIGLKICTTPAYSPESNGMAEAFVKTFKRDYVWVSDLSDAQSVMKQLPKWFEDYNEIAPHKALQMQSPRQYIKANSAG
jgi:putative transposase